MRLLQDGDEAGCFPQSRHLPQLEAQVEYVIVFYASELILDPNTAHIHLSLSEGNRKVTWVKVDQLYPDHSERFDRWPQVLCREGLSGSCYWEAKWSGEGVRIAVAYKSIQRKGGSDESTTDSLLGRNDKSWSLWCSPLRYTAMHNNKGTGIPAPSSRSRRVAVYLDWLAGTLSFYSVSSDTLTHLHTFHSTFTEPLYPGFGVYHMGSSVSLVSVVFCKCRLLKMKKSKTEPHSSEE
ncbi:stonustoxin subunit beta-like [Clupea harengus]|uniref:Stonustoxin subunit beta-like n=1 Tax=Clupea harengus TaxID=7950 RepID=A0A8M1KAU7_CLUHA|nr:stonustoxin subunit beta-like [Clupea harengus]